MQRQDVNPWEWAKAFGFSQAVDVAGAEHVLMCSGQTAFIGASGASAEALGSNLPAMTLIGVARLAFPELKVEIEAIAAK